LLHFDEYRTEVFRCKKRKGIANREKQIFVADFGSLPYRGQTGCLKFLSINTDLLSVSAKRP
jgi:hypothetical protein